MFITAEGLLMYLQPEEAMGLITECAKRFPGGQMIFDLPPVIVKKLTRKNGMRSSRRYRVPPMPFSLSPPSWPISRNTVPGIRAVHDLPIPKGQRVFCSASCFRVLAGEAGARRHTGAPTPCSSSADAARPIRRPVTR